MPALRVAVVVLAVGTSLGCSATHPRATQAADPTSAPRSGACRPLTPADTARRSDSSAVGDCSQPHTAETFLVGRFPATLAKASYTSRELGRYVYSICQPAFVRHLGGEESIAMRSLFSWAWFRPSPAAWAKQARWFRCDVVGGPDGARSFRALPATTKDALAARPPEDWMMCARGAKVAGSPRVPCSTSHDWRAVTTIKLGQPQDAYPGDRVAQIRSQQFCSDSVGAWLGYPSTNYQYGVTVLRESDWLAGNRRSICWARTAR